MAENAVHAEISAKDLGEILGVGERWVRQLENQGVIVKSGYGKYDLAKSVQAYIAFKVKTEVARAQPEATSADERLKAERERKLRLENDQTELRLIDTEIAISAVDIIVGMLRSDLAGVPARVSEDVATRRRLEDAINEALDRHADRAEKAGTALQAGLDPFEATDEDGA